ncbi:MAG: penicillin-binding protein 2 [Bacteroidia bacterium]|nr:penicillin-binding protein 2 [Bacteroidia bacterium]
MKNPYADRRFTIAVIILIIAGAYIIRLFYLQIIDTELKLSANNNVLRYVTIYPARGLIYDRNGKLMVENQAVYDLMVIPRQIKQIDTADLINTLDITKAELIEGLAKAKNYSRYKPSVLIKQISSKRYAILQEKLYKYPGFFVQPRTLRIYPRKSAAHALGYIGEVDEEKTKKDRYYKSGDYIGISGLEQSYEKELRGKKGVSIYMVDVHNRIKGNFQNGKFDTTAIVGKSLKTTIDLDIQEYGEKLMENKVGSIVAIEPSTGEILCMVTSPTYDPNLLIGRERSKNYPQLNNDIAKPLLNRALQAKYPPGSIFKIIQALVGLQMGVIKETTGFPCDKSIVNCHNHPSASNIREAVQYSCNPYFYRVFQRIIQQGKSRSIFKDSEIGLKNWHDMVITFGLGKAFETDINYMKGGRIPDCKFYDRWYGKGRWAFQTIYSLSIGQGEVEIVPIQMANFVTIVGNKGYYYTPHLVKEIGDVKISNPKFHEKHNLPIDREYFEMIVDGMMRVVESGTARLARIKDIDVCGKTGTAQNPRGDDHSVFIAFAPKDNPKIAIAVYVENAGFGGVWAAPMASLIIEKYLTHKISDPDKEQRILDFDNLEKSLNFDKKRDRLNKKSKPAD